MNGWEPRYRVRLMVKGNPYGSWLRLAKRSRVTESALTFQKVQNSVIEKVRDFPV